MPPVLRSLTRGGGRRGEKKGDGRVERREERERIERRNRKEREMEKEERMAVLQSIYWKEKRIVDQGQYMVSSTLALFFFFSQIF